MKTLVVDDYTTMRRIVRNLLVQNGHTDIGEAGDGQTALQMLRETKYDLVICDWTMEPMSGLDLLRMIRAEPSIAKTPFIMVTADGKFENVMAGKAAGMNNYIVKPFNADTLQQKISAVMG